MLRHPVEAAAAPSKMYRLRGNVAERLSGADEGHGVNVVDHARTVRFIDGRWDPARIWL